MSDRKAKSVQRLSRAVWKLYRRLSKGLVTWLLRSALLLNRQRRAAAGFVLPTTVFLILVVALTAGALSYRAYNSSTRTIGNIQSRAIYNAATPAIDRARSKIEALFSDPRYPGGVPSEGFLTSMMLNDGQRTIKGVNPATRRDVIDEQTGEKTDPFTLPGEKRIDINGDGLIDNAWVYHDKETKSSVVYSITFSIPADDPNPGGLPGWKKLLQKTEVDKALGIDSTESKNAGPFVRTGPLSNSEAVTCRVSSGSTVEQGWYQDATDTSKLRKRFQIDAFVVKDEDAVSPGKPPNLTTLEFSQDRLLERGNKWGAWFRNDLEIFPGRPFNWNGAMHTEGSLLIGPTTANNFSAYLISSPSSCLFLPESNSEISVRQVAQEDNTQVGNRFTGVIGSGDIRSNSYGGGSAIHVYQNKGYDASRTLNPSTQLVNSSKRPYSVSLDPATIVTSDGYKAREGDPSNYTDGLPAVTNTNVFIQGKRIVLDPKGDRPYVDDTYRADNRYGPKPNYGKVANVPTGKIGQPINAADFPDRPGVIDGLTREIPVGDPSTVGLDGYWERRSIVEGLRILVGQRLELGNPAGWVPPQDRPTAQQAPDALPVAGNGSFTDLRQIGNYGAAANGTNADPDTSDNEGDPLYPPHRFADPTRAHEERQRRTLRDNLAAVQATAVYHYKADGAGTFPTACLVTTAHPGTPQSLQRSVDFRFNQYLSTTGAPEPWIDFFYGKGTNGWEFSPPAATEADFAAAIAAGQPLGNALRNLANFAGDPEGAFPPQQGTAIRPDPTMTMWGNFSNLRRAVATLDASNYNSLSPADKTYLHTAACTLGMLAYNLEQVQKFDPTASYLDSAMTTLGRDLYRMMDGNNEPGQVPDVLPKEQLSTYKDASGNYTGTYNPANYNPRDYDRVTPAMFLAALKNWLGAPAAQGGQGSEEPERDERYQLALLIHEHYQLRRDRTYGFRPSPAANTWNYNPYLVGFRYVDPATNTVVTKPTLWSSACDPNLFPLGGRQSGAAGATGYSLATSQIPRQRLALSRLCGAVIPPGAVRDFPGDNNYPARGAALENPLDADTTVTDEFKKLSPTISSTPNTVFTQTTLNTAPYDDPSFKRALVAPEFPSLYYLFPEFEHDQDGDVRTTVGGKTIDHRQPGNTTDGTPRLNQLPAAFQPWPEPYITTANSINSTVTYRPVSTADTPYTDGLFMNGEYAAVSYTGSGVLPEGITSFNYKPFQPFPEKDKAVSFGSVVRPRATDLSDWKLPTASTPAANSPNRIRTLNNTIAAVAFQDKVLFNGREWQPARVLDVDLDMLRSTPVAGGEAWLPISGVVYAFREDAVREDAIARPAGTTNPPSLPDVKQTDARTPGAETDPPLTAGAVSTKPVDYVPDPDRRIHGFRLRNGEKLKRTAGGVDSTKNTHGLSFFSDNPAYIMGNFNKHQDSNGNRLEEFTQQVGGTNYSTATFYDQRTTRDPNFAKTATDEWRPSEVLADTITILSNGFCDGGIIDTFTAVNVANQYPSSGIDASAYNNPGKGLFAPGCGSSSVTSFMNQNRPNSAPQTNWNWQHENPSDPLSPVKISRNGHPLVQAPVPTGASKAPLPVEYTGVYNGGSTTIPGGYYNISGTSANSSQQKRSVQPVDPNLANPANPSEGPTVNTIFISGIVPSRLQQSYGGLHNFPRFLEWWQGVNLNFSGSFLQLNFS
ncbi:MAG: hormogonium polysaccharide biosynthesis protein HpsA, partial [Leptodesmis sp.]|uniref:hormogonium polysaccharide biosynthesis protein HpsA n=1 Tax=Leptodesmis sp. TaxID=3100501 RepID=UPI003D13E1C9